MDRLDFIHSVCQQIPDAKLHPVRSYGAHSCKKRKLLCEARAAWAGEEPTQDEDDVPAVPAEAPFVPSTDVLLPATPGSAEARRRPSWARMLKKVFEVDPLVCKGCGEEMEIVAWITKVDVIDPSPEGRRSGAGMPWQLLPALLFPRSTATTPSWIPPHQMDLSWLS